MMRTHFVMNYSGDSTFAFDEKNPKALAEAKERVDAWFKQGGTIATRKSGDKDYTVIRSPDQEQDESLFIPRLQGG